MQLSRIFFFLLFFLLIFSVLFLFVSEFHLFQRTSIRNKNADNDEDDSALDLTDPRNLRSLIKTMEAVLKKEQEDLERKKRKLLGANQGRALGEEINTPNPKQQQTEEPHTGRKKERHKKLGKIERRKQLETFLSESKITYQEDDSSSKNQNPEQNVRSKREPVVASVNGTRENGTLFLHIQKTAGTTLRSVLKLDAQKRNLYAKWANAGSAEGLIKQTQLSVQADVVFGHFDYKTASKYISLIQSRSWRLISVLREPVDRVLSVYYFRKMMGRASGTLEEFVAHNMDVNNWQFRALLPKGRNMGALDQNVKNAGEVISEVKKIIKEQFSLVGITEKFDEFLFMLKKLGIVEHIEYVKHKVISNRPKISDLSPDLIKQIKDQNQYDLEIYKYVQDLFEEKLNHLTTKEKEELEQYKLEQEKRKDMCQDDRNVGNGKCMEWNQLKGSVGGKDDDDDEDEGNDSGNTENAK